MAYDLNHNFGSDLQLSNTGDLAVVDGTIFGQQRCLRRLLTNPGDYIYQLDYGAGLAAYIGQPMMVQKITAVVRQQMLLETAVSQNPLPVVNVTSNDDTLTVSIQYVDATSGVSSVLTIPITS